jgi:hypothetical protein
MLVDPQLFSNGFHVARVSLGDAVRTAVRDRDWVRLDREFARLAAPGGRLFDFLRSYHDFSEIEFIISIRSAVNEWEEDGIWHDDGSRVFAFSLSLTVAPETVAGGRLGIRRKGQEPFSEIPTPGFGTIILFLTGVYGFEHKIHRVTAGERIIIAGWCS